MSSPTQNQSFLAAGITALSPWGSRSATPKPPPLDRGREDLETVEPVLEQQRGRDHTVSRRNRLSLRSYPSDCPPLSIQWYHAIDAPKRKPRLSGDTPASEKPLPPPKKFIPFSKGDSRAIEALYQRLSQEDDASAQLKLHRAASDATRRKHRDSTTFEALEGADHTDRRPHEDRRKFRVPVNEDYLFDVDVEARELAPAYWLGPVYDVCRGMWFFQDSSGLRPCDENLATQLEEGYLKLQPWKFPQSQAQRSTSQARSRPVSLKAGDLPNDAFQSQRRSSNPVTPKSSDENLKVPKGRGKPLPGLPDPVDADNPNPTRTLRLFGPHTNTVVTYQDASTAWLVTDSALSKLSSAMYQRFAGGGYFAGTKVVRGFNDGDDIKDEKKTATPTKSSSPDRSSDTESPKADESDQPQSPSETHRQSLERKMSALVNSVSPEDREKQEEEARKREEEEMRDDYQDQDGAGQGREIEHLLLVTHGIGQRLGLRMESVNFVHDVNTLRKTLKSVYAHSPDLQALNHEVDKLPKNSRVQVLPICWRHLLDFPKQSLKHNRQEHDLGDADGGEDDHYPNLDDITIEGVPAVRNLITDLALDILLYQSPAYKGHISRIVAAEINRIYKLFTERNPSFNGRVSLVGHSLGSAIMFDILCRQREDSMPSNKHHKARQSEPAPLRLDFDVEDFFALGSPIGLFQMLRGRTVAARRSKDFKPSDTPADVLDDPFMTESVGDLHSKKFEITVSSPKCARLFNIFHPTDPISYRIEPLISSSMASLKPQPLPYTKKGIFGAPVGAGLTGIGARVGQSVSGLWTSFSSGIASSLLNRSLGISGEDATSMRQSIAGQNQQAHAQHQQQHFVPPQPRPLSLGAGTNIASAGVVPAGPVPAGSQPPPPPPNATHVPQRQFTQNDITTGEDGEHPPTLIDTELETLWGGWEKKRRASGMSVPSEESGGAGEHAERDEEWRALEEQARRLRREEAKVRALNANGRVDYSIQEGAFDISLLASIASHLSYWADEDVSHFMVSQLLARHRVLKESVRGENVRG